MNELHLFAGAGGGILGGMLLGHTCVCAVEIEPYCRKVLLQRQRDEILPKFPIWDDVRTFDGKPWRGRVDVVCGGFPCQDISAAGKGAGITGQKSGLWKEFARIIGEVRPSYVLVENSPMLTIRGLGTVLGDLAEMGYDADWCVLGACDAGAPHKRDRMWIVAYPNCNGLAQSEIRGSTVETAPNEPSGKDNTQYIKGAGCLSSAEQDVADSNSKRGQVQVEWELSTEQLFWRDSTTRGNIENLWWSRDPADVANAESWRTGRIRDEIEEERARRSNELSGKCGGLQGALLSNAGNNRDEQRIRELREVEQTSQDGRDNGRGTEVDEIGERRAIEPFLGRVAHGVASRVDRLKAAGNGQVPAVVELAWKTLTRKENCK